jgi:cytoskeletal protein CcmA (bactofilin family)
MFDMSKRGSGRSGEFEVDEEMDNETARGARPAAPSASPSPPSSAKARGRDAAVVGPSIHIQGDLRGEEELLIEGSVTGTIHLEDYALTIGASGKVKAEVYAQSIVVDGAVEGDMYAAERVTIRRSGDVNGNMVSPRISLEDGGRFKGSIEMDQQAVDAAFGTRRPQTSGTSAAPTPAAPKPTGGAGTPGGPDKGKEPASKGPSGAGEGGQGDKKSAAG